MTLHAGTTMALVCGDERTELLRPPVATTPAGSGHQNRAGARVRAQRTRGMARAALLHLWRCLRRWLYPSWRGFPRRGASVIELIVHVAAGTPNAHVLGAGSRDGVEVLADGGFSARAGAIRACTFSRWTGMSTVQLIHRPDRHSGSTLVGYVRFIVVMGLCIVGGGSPRRGSGFPVRRVTAERLAGSAVCCY